MLRVRSNGMGGFRITSSPRNINITVSDTDEVAAVVKHYFHGMSVCAPDCPLCKQLSAKFQKHLTDNA